MLVNPKNRFIAALLLLLIFLLYSNWLILKDQNVPENFEFGNDKISTYGRNIDGVKEVLPSGVDRIGFITNVPIVFDRNDINSLRKNERGSPDRKYYKKILDARRNYVITQYLLSPLMIYPDSKERFVMLNIKGANADYRHYIPDNYKLYKDFGDGIMIFEDNSR